MEEEQDPVWQRINEELDRRKTTRTAPSTWAALAGMIGANSQTTTNWKTRGVPPKQYAEIARSLGWTMEQLLSDERTASEPGDPLEAPYQKVYKLLTEEQRRAVYAHALELALNLSPEDAQRAANTAAGLAGTDKPRGRGQHQGGIDTNYGDLDEGDQGKVKGGRR